MKVARLTAPGAVDIVDDPRPEPAEGESLVRVGAVGLCGSDLHWFGEGGIGDALLSRPLVLGHEFGGMVEGGPLDGQRVAVDPAIPDYTCERCREGNTNLCPQVRFAGHGSTDGGLREYIAWPTALLHPVPGHFDDATVAMLEPLGVALHCLDLGHVHLGNSAAVVGCGPIGLMLLQALRVAGAARVVAVEPLEHRRDAAARSGADLVLSPEQAGDHHGEVDIAFEVAGTDDAVATSMQLVRAGGRLVLAGIPDDDRTTFPAALARRKGLTMAMARRMKEAYPRAIDLVGRGVVELDWLASKSFALADTAEAFSVAARREGLKILVQAG
ncbi:MAG TPA: alcohol dehydrogenase catalytic domain-containing protein [Acidimicrobiales bacterium]|nr:alcohol dehydrogenase catalytic domain-containing protein [Acidimicrobiales bacterium]